jgi:hypothetical protein
MCYEEYTIRRCRWCDLQFGKWDRTHRFFCTYYRNNERSPRCHGHGGPEKGFVEVSSVCTKAFCQQQQHAAVNRARGDARKAARERDRQLEEAARRREEVRVAAARQRARARQEERDRRELARYRNGTLFSGYDEDEEFQAWLRAGNGWRG